MAEHEQNSDEYLAQGKPHQVSAQELRLLLDKPVIDDGLSSPRKTWSSSKLASWFASAQKAVSEAVSLGNELRAKLASIQGHTHREVVVFRDFGKSVAGIEPDEQVALLVTEEAALTAVGIAVVTNSAADSNAAITAYFRDYRAGGTAGRDLATVTINEASPIKAIATVAQNLRPGDLVTVRFVVSGTDADQFRGLMSVVSWQ